MNPPPRRNFVLGFRSPRCCRHDFLRQIRMLKEIVMLIFQPTVVGSNPCILDRWNMMKSPVEGLRHWALVAMNDGACGNVFAGYRSFLIHPDSIPASASIPQNLQSINRPDLEPCFSRWVLGPTKWPRPRPWHMHSHSRCPAQVLDKQKPPTEELDRQEKVELFFLLFDAWSCNSCFVHDFSFSIILNQAVCLRFHATSAWLSFRHACSTGFVDWPSSHLVLSRLLHQFARASSPRASLNRRW